MRATDAVSIEDTDGSPTRLGEMAAFCSNLLDQAQASEERLSSLCNRAFGHNPAPPAAEKQAPEPDPNGGFASVEIILKKIERAHEAIRRYAKALDSIA